MKCETVQELMSARADDELPAAERTVVQEHARTCALCAEAQVWLRETKATIQTLARQEQALPAGLWPAVLRRLDTPPASQSTTAPADYTATARPWLVRVPVRAAMSFSIAAVVVGIALGIAWFTPMADDGTDAVLPMEALALEFELQAAAAAPPRSPWGPFSDTAGPFMQSVKYGPALMRPPDPHMTFVGQSTRYVNGVMTVAFTYSSDAHSITLYQLPAARARLPAQGVGGSPGRIFRLARTQRCCVVAWTDGDTAFAVISDLPPGALLGIAETLAEAARAPGA